MAKLRKGLAAGAPKLGRGRPASKAAKRAACRKKRIEQKVRDLFEHRYLFVRHHLTASERKTLTRFTRGQPQLRTLRGLMEEVYRLFDRRCRTATALTKLARLRSRLRRFVRLRAVLKKLFLPGLEKALVFLDEKGLTQNKLDNFWYCNCMQTSCMVSQETLTVLHEKYQALAPFMDERVLRRWAASEAQALGWGGASAVTKATGISRTTIRSGIAELHQSTPEPPTDRIRKPGAGRPRLTEGNPRLLDDLHTLLESATRGDPEAPLLWTSKSTRNLADELVEHGHQVSHDTVGRLLEEIGYSLQAHRKTLEGKDHPDRDAQFEYINQQVCAFQKARQPVVSVDAKKKELIGDFQNPGREWHRRGEPEEVRARTSQTRSWARDPRGGL